MPGYRCSKLHVRVRVVKTVPLCSGAQRSPGSSIPRNQLPITDLFRRRRVFGDRLGICQSERQSSLHFRRHSLLAGFASSTVRLLPQHRRKGNDAVVACTLRAQELPGKQYNCTAKQARPSPPPIEKAMYKRMPVTLAQQFVYLQTETCCSSLLKL